MSQQINLFNPVFNQKKRHFSAQQMVQALGLVLLLGLAWAAYIAYRVSPMEQLAQLGQEQVAAQEIALTQANLLSAPRQKSKQLILDTVQAETMLRAMQQAATLLAGGKFGDRHGYSDYFRGFARQALSGLWLTGLSISGSKHDIGIEGQTLHAELVPQYIERLANEPVFQGKSFSSLEIAPAPALPASGKPAAVAGAAGGMAGGISAAAAASHPLLAFKLEASGVEEVIVKASK